MFTRLNALLSFDGCPNNRVPVECVVFSALRLFALQTKASTGLMVASSGFSEAMPTATMPSTKRATLNIFQMRDWLKMRRFAAMAHIAGIVKFFASWYWADKHQVENNVNRPLSPLPSRLSVFARPQSTTPEPTSSRFADALKQAFDGIRHMRIIGFGAALARTILLPFDIAAEWLKALAANWAGFHSSFSSHDLQMFSGGNRFWRERVSARENLSPRQLYIGATA